MILLGKFDLSTMRMLCSIENTELYLIYLQLVLSNKRKNGGFWCCWRQIGGGSNIAWCRSSRGRHVFDFTSLTDEGIGMQSLDILSRAE